MQTQEPHQDYPVLSVGIESLIDRAEIDAEVSNLLAFAKTMTTDEWKYLAELMADDLYDGDRFVSSMIRAVLKVKARREQ
jgi:hypothetical protein